jgi:hypothetical protein
LAPDSVSKYIIRKYTDDMAGTNISDKCEVRLRNWRLFSEEEVFDFWRKSTAACPMYGVCYWCFGSGPTNMYRQVCQDENRTYKILLTADQVTIDAEWVSRFFRMTHLIAKADRTQNWLSAEQQLVAMDDIKAFVNERWNGGNENVMLKIGTWELFQEGLTWNCHSQCLRSRSKGRKVEILIIEPEALYNGRVQDGKQQFDNRSVLDG